MKNDASIHCVANSVTPSNTGPLGPVHFPNAPALDSRTLRPIRAGKTVVLPAGMRFGRWIVIERGAYRGGEWYWRCACDCGHSGEIRGSALRSGKSQSCGCLTPLRISAVNLTHGHRRTDKAKSSEYTAWINLRMRCENPNEKGYANYGGRGITVCPEWRDSFETFLRDMGPKPSPRHSIDRINNDGPYAPWNCRWATWTEQARNRRPPRKKVHA